MTYGNLIAYCETINGDCIVCEKLADCKSFRKGLQGQQPCYISRLWNEEIKPYTCEVHADERIRKSEDNEDKQYWL